MLARRRSVTEPIPASELVLNKDGSVYHIALKDHHVADTLILVGDQNRVRRISRHFSEVEFEIENREFITHTGTYNGKRVTVISTGIGADNVDIVVNELDAAVNIDPETRMPKDDFRQLKMVRLGTSGALQPDIPVDSFLMSRYAVGFDGVAHFYQCEFEEDELALNQAFMDQLAWKGYNPPYFVRGSEELLGKLAGGQVHEGLTITANGFYGPQGRQLMLAPKDPDLNDRLRAFSFDNQRITNYEMETSALYALSSLLGHQAATICAVIANRSAQRYSADYKITVDDLIQHTLDRLTS